MEQFESVIREIQKIANRCINNEYTVLTDSIFLKLQYLDNEQRKSYLNQEIFRSTGELVNLRKDYSVIEPIILYIDNPDFFWESSFMELLSTDERKKFLNFNLQLFDLKSFSSKKDCYDNELPYFSQIIRFVALSKYVSKLKQESESYKIAEPIRKIEATTAKIPITTEVKIKKTFESNFSKKQIEILTKCSNEANIFTESVSFDVMKQIFDCELQKSLRVKNNRLLAYFLVSLDDRSYITHNWQSVCESNQLFLSSMKGNILKQSDLSTATNECRDNPPKGSETIDKYLKQLKEH